MQIYVKIWFMRRLVTLEVQPSETIYDVKEKIFETERILPCSLMILMRGKPVFDFQTISSLNTTLFYMRLIF